MSEDPAYYDRALRRLDRFALALAGAAVVGMGIAHGWKGALGAAGGAAFSLGSFRTWKRVAAAVTGDAGARPGTWLVLRYTILAASLFVIIRYFGVSLWSVLAGLLVPMAAVMAEIVCELFITHS